PTTPTPSQDPMSQDRGTSSGWSEASSSIIVDQRLSLNSAVTTLTPTPRAPRAARPTRLEKTISSATRFSMPPVYSSSERDALQGVDDDTAEGDRGRSEGQLHGEAAGLLHVLLQFDVLRGLEVGRLELRIGDEAEHPVDGGHEQTHDDAEDDRGRPGDRIVEDEHREDPGHRGGHGQGQRRGVDRRTRQGGVGLGGGEGRAAAGRGQLAPGEA